MAKYSVEYKLSVPNGGVTLTGGRLKKAFDNNLSFLKKFDLDRMLYWYRRNAGKPAPGVPYAANYGHFENNLHGQTAGEFLMGAGCSLLWQEDAELRSKVRALLDEMSSFQAEDGYLVPVPRKVFQMDEYPNYTRAWITFGLLDAGACGEQLGYQMARRMGDHFNHSDVLPYVKNLNLGFQGILASTRLYDSPVGIQEDVDTAISAYQETWWLQQLIADEQRAIYQHPGNHPHSTLLTTLEAYCDLYRATGEEIYLQAVQHALKLYEDKWQHVGGGISMCEGGVYYPGCNWLNPSHNYNELCSTNFWVLLNQRMHRLFPENTHFVDEMETSIYNVLLAAQVDDVGYHYLNYLQRTKDWRFLDPCTCCASLGTRLVGLLPQFLFTYTEDSVNCDIYACSEAVLPNGVHLRVETGLPDRGCVRVEILSAAKPFTLRLRIPGWAAENGDSYYEVHTNVSAGQVFEKNFPMHFRMTKYTGGDEIVGKDRWAMEYGPLLYAVMGGPNPLSVHFDPAEPEKWFLPEYGDRNTMKIRDCDTHFCMAYLDIRDEPFDVYPIVE